MVDQKLIERKIRRMEEYLRELKKVPIKSLEEFTENTVVKRFVERNIEKTFRFLPGSSAL